MDVPEPQAKSWTIGAKNKGKRNLRFFFFHIKRTKHIHELYHMQGDLYENKPDTRDLSTNIC